MDDRDRDLEALLRRTAQPPASGPDPRDIVRRARRRTVALRGLGAVAVLAVALGAGAAVTALRPTEGADVVFEGGAATETAEATTTPSGAASPPPTSAPATSAPASPSPAPGAPPATATPTTGDAPEESPAPPERWVGVRAAGDRLEVVLHDSGGERTLGSVERTSAEAPDLQATDVVLDAGGGTVLVGVCCEPVSGSFFRADLGDSGDGTLEPVNIQGFRADLAGGLFARTDTFGILGLRPAFPATDGQEIRDGASAADVGVEPGARARVAALVDPGLASMPGAEGGERGVLVTERAGDGTWQDQFVPLEAPACALAFLADGRVGLLRPDTGAAADVLDCTGARVDVLDVATGTIDEGAVTFPEAVRNLGSDDAGEYVIAAGGSGQVHWATLDGDGGTLADGGYVAADW